MQRVDLYIIQIFLKRLLVISLSFGMLLFLMDITNLINLNTASLNNKSLFIIISGNVSKALYESLPFCFAIATSLAVNYLKKTSQLVIILGSGISIIRFSRVIIIFSFLMGIFNIYVTAPLINKLAAKSNILTYALKSGKKEYIDCNIRDELSSTVKYVLSASCQQQSSSDVSQVAAYNLKNILLIEYTNNEISKVFKAAKGSFQIDKQEWWLKNVGIIDNKKSTSSFAQNTTLPSSLSREGYEKQTNIKTGPEKGIDTKYNIYDLQKIILQKKESLSNEPLVVLKIKMWIIYRKSLEILNSVIISILFATITISGRSNFGITSLIMPLSTIGLFIYLAGMGDKMATNIMSLPFGFVFAPTLAISLFLILLMVNK